MSPLFPSWLAASHSRILYFGEFIFLGKRRLSDAGFSLMMKSVINPLLSFATWEIMNAAARNGFRRLNLDWFKRPKPPHWNAGLNPPA